MSESFLPKIGVFHPIDPAGYVPSGIDSFIRGILEWAPVDLDYVLFGATSDPIERPVGHWAEVVLGSRRVRYLPLVWMNPTATRGKIPLIVRYISALRKSMRRGDLDAIQVLDFHRVEPALIFGRDKRPMNLLLHQDMSVLRSGKSDIMWRHAPWAYELLERRVLPGLSSVFTVRQSAVSRYQNLFPSMADKFSFIPTWVDTSRFKPVGSNVDRQVLRQALAVRHGLDPHANWLVFVGRLDYQKDPMLLLEALRMTLARGCNVTLLIIGDGGLRAQVAAEIQTTGLGSRVALVGVKGAAEIVSYLQASDLFVLSSVYEGMPIAVLEALASGIPVVSTDVGEVGLVVKNGINGYLAISRSAVALADAIALALSRKENISGAVCQTAVEIYSPQKVLGQIFDNHRNQVQIRTPSPLATA